METENFAYYAFISYSHNDKEIAQKLQKRLEHYHMPSKLLEDHPELPKKLSPIFRDESDLVARDGTLSDSLKGYLKESNYLILICSPSSAHSIYVGAEVDYFINELGRVDRIIPLIVDGLPHSKDPDIECFPPAILALDREHEPLGIDLKTFGKRDAFLRVIATLLKLKYTDFKPREDEERKRRAKIFASIAAVLVMIIGGLAWYSIETFILMESNDPEAQFNFGVIYEGRGDYAKAREWYEKAVAQGFALAQNNLGWMYYHGQGVEQDYAKAMELYQKAAAQGYASAQNNLGYMYANGDGVERDYAKAREWYEKAAAQGNASAQYNLGLMYANGDGVERDYAKAREWYEKAAAQGNATAQFDLGDMYWKGYGVEKDYAKAREWYQKAAAQGEAIAQSSIALMYFIGQGVEKDYDKAMEWYQKAAAQGEAFAQYAIGLMYYDGEGVEQNYSKAREWFEKAAAQGDAYAQKNLGIMYRDGLGVPQSNDKAIEYFRKAILQGNEDAKKELVKLYQELYK